MDITEYKRLLSSTLHKIRSVKTQAQVAQDAFIQEHQLAKYRAESCADYRPHIDEHERLVRVVHEISPDLATALIEMAVPSELYRVVPVDVHPSPLMQEMVQLMGATGNLARVFELVMRDGKVTADERELLKGALAILDREAAEYHAAVDAAGRISEPGQ